ncbi:Pcl6p KNAG_0L01470 [Huiozyma naganishii CBS 8797]|uniref:Cyclin n=1 Tax=Huiozyma naganishii (strain ATCC MYA-139 / BCRC 22969 / CBS 8797 / KCTC 17520 / NBRC 10181 / NCYC 3082 / Yp74L-3) TaxID=1071383 RepID=J7S3Q8_HUIN7|nr:hypothetical protein KNAG_0L01470 [Kazachstania naganishii CBS 8797]CCK72767.1 hypothetical protein KNAG_0L01470 [Kazachstania naganishii CBS 8797]
MSHGVETDTDSDAETQRLEKRLSNVEISDGAAAPLRKSIPLSREALEDSNSVIVTKVATEDTMSSSPSSYASSKTLPTGSAGGHLGTRFSPMSAAVRPGDGGAEGERREEEETQRSLSEINFTVPQHVSEAVDDVLDRPVGEPELEYPHALRLIGLSSDKLIKMLTALLDKIVQANDRLETPDSATLLKVNDDARDTDGYYESAVNAILSFKGKHIPQITLEQYFHRIQKYCPTTNDVFLSLLIYFDRISEKCNSIPRGGDDDKVQDDTLLFVMNSYNIHRLIIAGVAVSTKFSSDFFYSNARYAKVGGISLREMNYLELQFLVLCDFSLLISVEEMERYASLLYRFWDNSNSV